MTNATDYFPDLNGATFTRATAKNAWSSTQLTPFLSDVPATTDLGISIEHSATNRCTNTNADPVNTTNITFTDTGTGGSLAVADDATAVNAAGLGLVCTNGDVFRLIGGDAVVHADIVGNTANTNPHYGSAYIRGGTGSIRDNTGGSNTNFTASATYVRRQTSSITTSGRNLRISANAGQTVYFILNQLEEGPAVSTPIVTAGASASRNADVASLVTSCPPGFVVEFTGVEQTETGNPSVFAYSDGTTDNMAAIVLFPSGNLIKLRIRAGGVAQTDLTIGTYVIGTSYKVAVRLADNDVAAIVNGGAVVTDASVTIPTTTQMGIGSSPEFQRGALVRKIVSLDYAPTDAELAALVA